MTTGNGTEPTPPAANPFIAMLRQLVESQGGNWDEAKAALRAELGFETPTSTITPELLQEAIRREGIPERLEAQMKTILAQTPANPAGPGKAAGIDWNGLLTALVTAAGPSLGAKLTQMVAPTPIVSPDGYTAQLAPLIRLIDAINGLEARTEERLIRKRESAMKETLDLITTMSRVGVDVPGAAIKNYGVPSSTTSSNPESLDFNDLARKHAP